MYRERKIYTYRLGTLIGLTTSYQTIVAINNLNAGYYVVSFNADITNTDSSTTGAASVYCSVYENNNIVYSVSESSWGTDSSNIGYSHVSVSNLVVYAPTGGTIQVKMAVNESTTDHYIIEESPQTTFTIEYLDSFVEVENVIV